MFASTTQFLSLLSRFTSLTFLKLGWLTVGNGSLWDVDRICKPLHSTVSPIRNFIVDGLSSIIARDLLDYLLHPESPHPGHQIRHLHAKFEDQSLVARLLEAQASNHLQSLNIKHISEFDEGTTSFIHLQQPVEFTSLKRFTSLTQVRIRRLCLTESIYWILDLTAGNEVQSNIKMELMLSFGTCRSTDEVYDPKEWRRLDNQLSRWSSLKMLTLAILPQKFGEEETFPLLKKLVAAGKVVVPVQLQSAGAAIGSWTLVRLKAMTMTTTTTTTMILGHHTPVIQTLGVCKNHGAKVISILTIQQYDTAMKTLLALFYHAHWEVQIGEFRPKG
ncbi:hypothetical protein DL96DRAFT_1681197 [Flagelloscypha sp. PMI_526]|nr:hypothetical protein DL96DRAFT_1681197 [Flagelloscypha sp. PMI_526]